LDNYQYCLDDLSKCSIASQVGLSLFLVNRVNPMAHFLLLTTKGAS